MVCAVERFAVGNIILVIPLALLLLLLTVENGWSFPICVPFVLSRPLCWCNSGAVSCRKSRRRLNHRPNPATKDLLQSTPVKSSSSGFAASSDGEMQEAELRSAYENWRLEYGREFDKERYQNFRINYLKLTDANASELKNTREEGKPDPIPMSLNEYGDCSAEEYKTIQQEGDSPGSLPQTRSATTHPAHISAAFSSESPQEQQRIRQKYEEWCFANEKSFDESRLEIFAFNLKVVENYYKKTGKKAELNRFADQSPEEYKAAMTSMRDMSNSSTPIMTESASTLQSKETEQNASDQERIRSAYQDWCIENGREYHESRLNIFATNLNAVERYRRETGKVVKLNKYADLSPDEYRVAAAGESSNEPSKCSSFNGVSGGTSIPPRSATGNNPMLSYLENLTTPSPKISLTVEDRIRKIYFDWCQYYGKNPDEERLQIFAANLVVLEKHHIETGEELTLNEYADQTQGIGSKNDQEDLESLNKREQEERNRLEEDRAKMVQLEGEERMRNEEDARKLAQEKSQLEEERRQQEEKEQVAVEQQQKEEPRPEPENQTTFPDKITSLDCESSKTSVDEEALKAQSTKAKDKSISIALPRSSYMDAVARTWVDRSAYLESLQQGKVGVIPEPPPNESPWEDDTAVSGASKQSASLVNSIWDFINDNRRSASEQYAKRLIAEADDMIMDATKSSEIDGRELRHLQEAVDALRRRKNDELGAKRARMEAKEWEEIQRGLEKEAKSAKERRRYEERIAEESRQKARSLESGRKDSNSFSFLPNPFQGADGNSVFQSGFPTSPSDEGNFFSFFEGNEVRSDNQRLQNPRSSTQPVVVEKKESWLTFLFDIFGANQRKEEPGQGTITLEPAKRTSVFEFFVSPEMFAPKQPGRGSITIDEPKKPSVFSFFAKFGARNDLQEIDSRRRKRLEEYENRRRSRQEKLSWLEAGRSRILEETDKNLSRKEARQLQRELEELAAGNKTSVNADPNIPLLAKWTKTPDGRITGYVAETTKKFKMGTKITTSRISGQVIKAGITVTTTSGSQYRLGLPLSIASAVKRSANVRAEAIDGRSKIPPFRFPFGGIFADQDVPSLVEWTQNEDGTITGFVNNKIGFEDGTQITTSPVSFGARSGMTVQTRGGSNYKLLKEKSY